MSSGPGSEDGAARPAVDNGRVIAALDLGTNNCRLLIARADATGFRVVDSFARIVRLGEGLATTGRLSESATARAIAALRICAGKMRQWNVHESWVVATEACRRAQNGADFVKRVRDETGLQLHIISPAEEARLAVAGCAELIDPESAAALVFDIGGGSTELMWVRRVADKKTHIEAWTSMPVGVVNLAERFGGTAPTEEAYGQMVQAVQEHLKAFEAVEGLTQRFPGDTVHHLGISGTVTTLASLHLGLRRYARHRIDGIWMTDAEVAGATARMRALSLRERTENACIGQERADLVIPGCAILEAIRMLWPSGRLRVADRGLREGMLMALVGGPVERAARRRASGRRRRRGRGGNRSALSLADAL